MDDYGAQASPLGSGEPRNDSNGFSETLSAKRLPVLASRQSSVMRDWQKTPTCIEPLEQGRVRQRVSRDDASMQNSSKPLALRRAKGSSRVGELRTLNSTGRLALSKVKSSGRVGG